MCNGNEYEGRPYNVVTAKRYLYEEGMEPGYEIVPKDFNPYVGCAAGEGSKAVWSPAGPPKTGDLL